MNKKENGNTRFNLAKDEVEKLISESKNGSSYTIIFIGNDTQILCEGLENKKKAIAQLEQEIVDEETKVKSLEYLLKNIENVKGDANE